MPTLLHRGQNGTDARSGFPQDSVIFQRPYQDRDKMGLIPEHSAQTHSSFILQHQFRARGQRGKRCIIRPPSLHTPRKTHSFSVLQHQFRDGDKQKQNTHTQKRSKRSTTLSRFQPTSLAVTGLGSCELLATARCYSFLWRCHSGLAFGRC